MIFNLYIPVRIAVNPNPHETISTGTSKKYETVVGIVRFASVSLRETFPHTRQRPGLSSCLSIFFNSDI